MNRVQLIHVCYIRSFGLAHSALTDSVEWAVEKGIAQKKQCLLAIKEGVRH